MPQVTVVAIDHVQITVPRETEAAAKQFYGSVLGLPEIPQPTLQAAQGGAWYRLGGIEVHLKPEAIGLDETRRSKRHLAVRVRDLDEATRSFQAAGVEIFPDERPVPGVRRMFVRDPGGNRVEIIQA